MLLELAATVVHLVQRSLFVLVVRYDTNCILSPLIADVVKRVSRVESVKLTLTQMRNHMFST